MTSAFSRRRVPKHDLHHVSTPSASHRPVPEIIVHPPPAASERAVSANELPVVAVTQVQSKTPAAEKSAPASEASASSEGQPTEKAKYPPPTSTSASNARPLWLCHVLATYAQQRLLALYESKETPVTDAKSDFDRFWTWMTMGETEADAKDDGSSGSDDDIPLTQLRAKRIQQEQPASSSSSDEEQDLPLTCVAVKRSMRDEAFTLLSARDYFAPHDKKWWAAQLSEIEGMKKIVWRERRRLGKLRRERKRKGEVGVLEGDGNGDGEAEVEGITGSASKSEEGDESKDKSRSEDGNGSEDGSEAEFEMLDRTDGEDAEDMMELDAAELTDEGIEDISSDEELYGLGHEKAGEVRADSHLA